MLKSGPQHSAPTANRPRDEPGPEDDSPRATGAPNPAHSPRDKPGTADRVSRERQVRPTLHTPTDGFRVDRQRE